MYKYTFLKVKKIFNLLPIIIIKWKADSVVIEVVVINHGGGGCLSRNFESGPIWHPKWSDMVSKVVRYGFQY